jgi:urease accessory protein
MMDVPFFSSGNAPSRSLTGEPTGWRAELTLRFAIDSEGATRLVERSHHGPLVVQRPFYPEGPAVPHVYVLHPPGGLVGGDRLRLDVAVGAGAHTLITTPAASKVYRTAGPLASQVQTFDVGPGAALEWLPQEIILHDGAHTELTTRVHLGRDARFIGIDTLCFGLSARGETFATGRCRQRFEIWRGDRPIVMERGKFDAHDSVHAAPWGLGGARVVGSMVAAPAPAGDAALSALRAVAAAAAPGDRAGVTVLGDGDALVCRFVGGSAERARVFFQSAWTMLRPTVIGRPAVPPRIWAT